MAASMDTENPLQLGAGNNQRRCPVDRLLRLLLNPPQQNLTGRDIMNKTNHLSGSPNLISHHSQYMCSLQIISYKKTYSEIDITIDEHLSSPLTRHPRCDLLKLARCAGRLNLERLDSSLVLVKSTGVLPPAQDELGVVLGRLDDLLLYVDVNGRLDGAHEAGTHVDTLGAQAERSSQALAVGESTGSDERNLEGLACAAQEDEVGEVALADMASALEAVDGEEVDAELNGALGMADGGALMQDEGADGLELLDDGARAVAGGLDDSDALVDDDLGVCAVVRRNHGGEEGDVHAEGVFGHGLAAADLLA